MSQQIHSQRLLDVDPQTAALIAAEERRQREKIILIPSESLTPAPVREALGSVFTSVYAEGYPRTAQMKLSPEELGDLDAQLADYRRYADRRFYKGADLADIVESLAGRRAAEAFATPEVPAERIYANVQPLSGAAANLAVYETFVQPGDTVMGMDLTEGGHLTHGSRFNVTGKRYRIVSYAIDRKTGKLDYDKMLDLAKEQRPRMIIGGFTSYPWQPDWHKFREIADEVGAVLLADVAHTAGLIVGGVYPNPIGIADVVTFTTHKTLGGPRGAVILSTTPKFAKMIDTAIFPGQQGGPHVNKFAALAAALEIAKMPAFAETQRKTIENAKHLENALRANGLHIAYGGTDTHLLLVDLRELEKKTGFTMMGEIASRLLEMVGIVCNKNTLPGDTSAADAHGIRLGTPWATQRGMGKEEMEILAGIIAKVLHAIRPFEYPGLLGPLSRGKLPLHVLEEAKRETRSLIARIDARVQPIPSSEAPRQGTWSVLRVRGGRSSALLNEAIPSRLTPDAACRTFLFNEEGKAISDIIIGKLAQEDFCVLVPHENARTVAQWLTGLADGYTLFDAEDLFRKVPGPAVIEEMAPEGLAAPPSAWLDMERESDVTDESIADLQRRYPERFSSDKPYFVGQSKLETTTPAASGNVFSWQEPEVESPKRTALYDQHVALGARLVPFAGWEMPVWYSSALEEHRAVRETAGLFDLGHMGVFQIEGPGAIDFLNLVTSNYVSWIRPGQSQYAYLMAQDGTLIDDVMIYCRAEDRFLVVVNAANEVKDWEWLTGVNEGRYELDPAAPQKKLPSRVVLRDLKQERGVIDLAIQGPVSRRIFDELVSPEQRRQLAALERTEFCELIIESRQMVVARTGYTGEPSGYEIYVGGQDVVWLWQKLLEAGEPYGLLPCGLASRDSTRTEAGLPLYGHELEGPHRVDPFESGFGSYVKLHKSFFVGRAHCVSRYTDRKRQIVRFEVGACARPIREGAAVLDRNGTVIGTVTSCVVLGDKQVGLALLEKLGVEADTPIHLLNPARGATSDGTASLAVGSRVSLPTPGTITSRFMTRTPVLPPVGQE